MPIIIQEARRLARLGLMPILLHAAPGGKCTCGASECTGNSRGKHPIFPKWQTRQWGAEDEQRAGNGHPCNLGCRLGGPKRLVAIDVDGPEGLASLAELESELGALPPTLTQETGAGEHRLFRFPEAYPLPPNSVGKRGGIGRNVDLRSEGGQVVVWPSTHFSGRQYRWVDARQEIAELPEAWAARLAKPPAKEPRAPRPKPTPRHRPTGTTEAAVVEEIRQKYLDSAIDREVAEVRDAAEGTRNDQLNRSAFSLGQLVASGELSESTVVTVLREAARACGLSESETDATITSGLTAGAKEPRSTPDPDPQKVAAILRKRCPRDAPGQDPPPDLFDPDAPDVPPEAIAASPAQTIMVAADGEWTALLQYVGDPPKLAKTTGNLALILSHDDAWRGCLAHNAFAMTVSWQKRPPWPEAFPRPAVGDALDLDVEYAPVAHWFGFVHGLKSLPKSTVQDALVLAARAQSHHPVVAYLQSLEWDGTPRLSSWLSCYLGAAAGTEDDRVYLSTYGRLWLVSAVARIMQPGCQADLTLVLEGAQGIRKTSALRTLCPDPSWFLPRLPDLRGKDAQQAVLGKWIVEIAELDALKGANWTLVKDYLTQVYDDFRPPYGRTFVHHPRTCVFAASTNEAHWGQDPTGGRRFIPLACGSIDLSALEHDRDQLWAEAVAEYQEGRPWHCTEATTEAIARDQQEARYQVDAWEERIAGWAQKQVAPFTVGDVLSDCLLAKPENWDRQSQTRVGICLARLGYTTRGMARPRVYWRRQPL